MLNDAKYFILGTLGVIALIALAAVPKNQEQVSTHASGQPEAQTPIQTAPPAANVFPTATTMAPLETKAAQITPSPPPLAPVVQPSVRPSINRGNNEEDD